MTKRLCAGDSPYCDEDCIRCDGSCSPPKDFGQQIAGYEDPHPWLMPVLGGLAFAAYMLMLIMGKAPWQ